MSLLVIRRITQLEVHCLFVLVDPVEPKLRHIMCKYSIGVVHSNTSKLDLYSRRVLQIYWSRLVWNLQLLQDVRLQRKLSNRLSWKYWSGRILNLLIIFKDLVNHEWLKDSLHRYLQGVNIQKLAMSANKFFHVWVCRHAIPMTKISTLCAF